MQILLAACMPASQTPSNDCNNFPTLQILITLYLIALPFILTHITGYTGLLSVPGHGCCDATCAYRFISNIFLRALPDAIPN